MGKLQELPLSYKLGWPWNEEVSSKLYDVPGVVWPKISIITPSFNQGNFIEETIRSIVLQNYPNIEYIVMDGGSLDETLTILERYNQWITFWVSEKDKGQSDALIKGFNQSSGIILNWINSDDVLCKEGLYNIAKAFLDNSEADFVYGRNGIISIDSVLYNYMPFPKDNLKVRYLYEMPYGQQATFFKAEIYKRAGGINREINFSMDYELYLRMHLLGANTVQINHLIGSIRSHENTKTTKLEEVMHWENGNAFMTMLINAGEKKFASFLKKIGHKCYSPYEINIELNNNIIKSAFHNYLLKNIWFYYNNKIHKVSLRMALKLINLNKKYILNPNYLKIIKDGTISILQSGWSR